MTRTSAPDFVRMGSHMNAVDTGWVTDEDPLRPRGPQGLNSASRHLSTSSTAVRASSTLSFAGQLTGAGARFAGLSVCLQTAAHGETRPDSRTRPSLPRCGLVVLQELAPHVAGP